MAAVGPGLGLLSSSSPISSLHHTAFNLQCVKRNLEEYAFVSLREMLKPVLHAVL